MWPYCDLTHKVTDDACQQFDGKFPKPLLAEMLSRQVLGYRPPNPSGVDFRVESQNHSRTSNYGQISSCKSIIVWVTARN